MTALAGCGRAPDLTPDERAANAKKGAEAVAAATIAGDFGTVADKTYPEVVKMMGGREKMIRLMSDDEKSPHNYKIKSFTFDAVSQQAKDGDKCYAVLSGTMKLACPQGTLVTDSALLGISSDGGRNWTYISVVDPADVRRAIPSLPASLNLKKQPPPRLVPT